MAFITEVAELIHPGGGRRGVGAQAAEGRDGDLGSSAVGAEPVEHETQRSQWSVLRVPPRRRATARSRAVKHSS